VLFFSEIEFMYTRPLLLLMYVGVLFYLPFNDWWCDRYNLESISVVEYGCCTVDQSSTGANTIWLWQW
jgi:hypothetical protein